MILTREKVQKLESEGFTFWVKTQNTGSAGDWIRIRTASYFFFDSVTDERGEHNYKEYPVHAINFGRRIELKIEGAKP